VLIASLVLIARSKRLLRAGFLTPPRPGPKVSMLVDSKEMIAEVKETGVESCIQSTRTGIVRLGLEAASGPACGLWKET
jgi:hypothetical protein